MRTMLRQRRLEIVEKKLGIARRKAARPKPHKQFLLTGDVSLALNDMVVHHSEVGR
jgi:hypothetical protein